MFPITRITPRTTTLAGNVPDPLQGRSGPRALGQERASEKSSPASGGGGCQRTSRVAAGGTPAGKRTWSLRRISGLVPTFTSCGMDKHRPAELSVKVGCPSVSQKGAIRIKCGTKPKTLHEPKGCDAVGRCFSNLAARWNPLRGLKKPRNDRVSGGSSLACAPAKPGGKAMMC